MSFSQRGLKNMAINKNDYFINPYTFIPIPDEEPVRESAAERGDITGVIECSIEIKSPTFIPNTTKYFKTDKKEHYLYEFYSYDDLLKKGEGAPANPIIPGSEIRGMIRNVYEQFTNSCFLEVDENNLPYKRTALPKKAALMKYNPGTGGWEVYYKEDTTDQHKVKSIDTKRLFCEDSFIAIDGRNPNEWFTGLKFARYDSQNRTFIYNYEKDKGFPKKEYKIGDTAYLQIGRDGKIKGISKEQNSNFTNHEITINKKNTMKADIRDKKTQSYKFKNTEYNWGDTVYAETTNGRVENYAKNSGYVQNCDTKQNGEPIKYMLHLTPMTTTKKYFALYKDDIEDLKKWTLTLEDIERFENVLNSYITEKVNIMGKSEDKIKYYKQYIKLYEKKQTLLVYIDDNKTYISPSCITKEYFVNKIPDILNKQSRHDKCTDIDKLCPACRLFGMIGKNGSNTGRVRICDTHESTNICFGDKIVLPILGTPRISATEFYLQNPDDKSLMWNYDYWVEKYTEGVMPPILHKYMPSLAGRKVYWHGKLYGNTDLPEEKNMNMTNTIRPIVSGKFKFKVYFEDLDDDKFYELKNLIFSLNLNGEGLHKIGKGKPVGMGDIKVTVDKIKRRIYKLNDNIFTADYENISIPDSIKTKEAEQILAYTKPMPEDKAEYVAYPTISDPKKPQIFQWFTKNRGTIQSPTIIETLPSIMSIVDEKIYITKSPERKKISFNNTNISTHDIKLPTTYTSNEKIEKGKLFELPGIAKKIDEKPKSVFDEKSIKNALSRYKIPYSRKESDKTLLAEFVNGVKETDSDYPKWKDLLKEVKKVLK